MLSTYLGLYAIFAIAMGIISYYGMYRAVIAKLADAHPNSLLFETKYTLPGTLILMAVLFAPFVALVLLSVDRQVRFQEALYASLTQAEDIAA